MRFPVPHALKLAQMLSLQVHDLGQLWRVPAFQHLQGELFGLELCFGLSPTAVSVGDACRICPNFYMDGTDHDDLGAAHP